MGLFGELRARGYTGSRMTIERFLLGLRRMEQEGPQASKTATSVQLTPRRAVGLMLSRPTDRTHGTWTGLSDPSRGQVPQCFVPAICPDTVDPIVKTGGGSILRATLLLYLSCFIPRWLV